MKKTQQLNKIQGELKQAIQLRNEKKATYDHSLIILNGQRDTLILMEKRTNDTLQDFKEADKHVDELFNKINQLIKEESTDSVEV